MSIFEYSGSAIIAMKGKNCVAIASDKRFGIQLTMITPNTEKIFKMSEKVMVGLAGLPTDVQTVQQLLNFRLQLYKLRENREMGPKKLAKLITTMAYERRFGPYFITPVIAGLDDNNEPFVDSQDSIGAGTAEEDDAEPWVAGGTASEQLMGMCEALYRPDMEPDDLFETVSQALLAAVDRDAISGWGADVYVITPTEVIHKELKSRQD